MKKLKQISKLIAASALSLSLIGVAGTAEAGRDGSYSKIVSSISSGGVDAIISNLEKAENLVCSQCPDAVLPLLEHDDYRIREVAAWWFARRPAFKSMLSTESLNALSSADSIEVRNAADLLGTFRHPRAIAALSTAVVRNDLNGDAKVALTRALGTIGHGSASPALAVAMQDAEPAVRLGAVKAWRLIRHQSSAAPLVSLLADADVAVRREAAAVVGQYRDASGLNALVAQMSDADPEVRRNAVWAIGRIGSASARDAVVAATNDPSGKVRRYAQMALRNLR